MPVLTQSVISLIKSTNNNGPRIDPSGTPDLTQNNDEFELPITTFCVWFLTYSLTKLSKSPSMPNWVLSLCRIISWETESNAFAKSK